MAEKELRKLSRRELLQMLLMQCEESERLQNELDCITAEHEAMAESYERLKGKLNVKDERLNQKDEKIARLREEIMRLQKENKELKVSGTAGSHEAEAYAEAQMLTEATNRLNKVITSAQQAADRYLANMREMSEMSDIGYPYETSRRTGARRRLEGSRARQTLKAVSGDNRG